MLGGAVRKLVRGLKALVKRNPRSLTIVVVFLALTILGGVGAHLFERYPSNATHIDWITVVLYAMIFPTFIASGFVTIVSFKWLTKQWETEGRDTLFAEPLETALHMAHRRREIVNSCRKLTKDVYCTSHCNLFHNPGLPKGPDGAADKEEVAQQNRKFFRALAKLTIDSRQALRLLLFVPDLHAV